MRSDGHRPDEVVIDLWLPSYPAVPLYVDKVRRLASAFEHEHPGFRISIRESEYKTLPEDVFRAARQGRAPALVQYFHTCTQLARDMRRADGEALFTPVGRAIAGRTEILGEPVRVDDLVPAARDYYVADGELLAVPPLASTTLLYANRTLLDRAGVPDLPRTWAELAAACKAVTALPGGPGHGVSWPNHGWIFQQAVAQQGGLLADHGNGRLGRAERVDLAGAELLAFVQWWRELHRAGHYLYTGHQAYGENTARAWGDNFQAFAEQRVAFVLSSSVEAEWLVQAGRERGFEVAVGRMPHNGEAPYAGNLVGGDALWLADHPDPAVRDGALAFVQYLLRPRHAADRHRDTRFVPITRASAEVLRGDGWFAANPHHEVALDQLAAADGSPAARGALLGEFGRIQGLMTQAMEEVLLAGADPGQRFAQACGQAQRLLDDYHSRCLDGGPELRHLAVD